VKWNDRTFLPVLGMYLEVRRGGYSYIVARVAAKGHELECHPQIRQIHGIIFTRLRIVKIKDKAYKGAH
jgi:hypothetical protein